MGTVRVRIAVVVDPEGEWAAYGYRNITNETPGQVLDACLEGIEPGERYYWIEADVPRPDPYAEIIEGDVLPAPPEDQP